jgi:uncharacterized protein (DUF2236 family)
MTPRPLGPSPARPDAGLFGPQSVTWRVHADPFLFLGGLRALMLHALHPQAMAAVAQSSGFRADPWGRLERTAHYVGTVTYGTTAEAERAAARVRAVHTRGRAIDPATGAPIRLDDPTLLLWVHCAEIDSFLEAYRRSGGELGPGEADRYVAEQVRAATLIGIDGPDVPSDEAELQAYFARVRPELRAGAEAAEALAFLLWPPLPVRAAWLPPARSAWIALASLAFASLPAWARRCYGTLGLPSADLWASANLRVLRVALRAAPSRYRSSPVRRAAEARLAG